MELCHRPFWSEWFSGSYAPHYSQSKNLSDNVVDNLDALNLTKSLICAYLIIFALLLRISHLILLPVVTIVGSPVFLIYYCVWVKTDIKEPNAD